MAESTPLRLLVLPGDGIGPEIVDATQQVLVAAAQASGLTLSFSSAAIGFEALRESGTTFPEAVQALAQASDGCLLGPVSHNAYPPVSEGGLNPSAELRRRLDLYANLRPARARCGLPTRVGKPIDLVIVRENTEGFYADRSMFRGSGELQVTEDLALAVRKVSRRACLRIAQTAFRLAGQRRRRVTAVHKANVLRTSDGLFLESVRSVAREHPDIQYDECLVDAMAALLVRDPSPYDVIVTTNMFGDILSDEAAEIAGSLGMAPSLNVGAEHALAQAQHGSAPDLAGQDAANPSSLIGSAAMLLDWLAERRQEPRLAQAAAAIHAAVDATLACPQERTRDLGGMLGTRAFTQRVIGRVARGP